MLEYIGELNILDFKIFSIVGVFLSGDYILL